MKPFVKITSVALCVLMLAAMLATAILAAPTGMDKSATEEIKVDGKGTGVSLTQYSLSAGTTYTLDFKWADNLPYTETACDPMWFYDMGDTAPNERFNYRYKASFSGMSFS